MANSTVNEDPRLAAVETEESTAINNMNTTYDGMVGASDTFYNNMAQETKDWETTQKNLQNQQTQLAINEINQQKSQANADYLKEQSGAYVDWQKQTDQYGVNAEKMAANGMTNTGYSESSKVAMYTAYQNRVATAREVYNRAVIAYDQSIAEAKLQNSVALAEIAHQSLQTQLELALQGFQYKNTLLLDKANKELEIKSMYHQQYQDVLDQINAEKALEEEKRQFDEAQKLDREKFEEDIRRYNAESRKYTIGGNPAAGTSVTITKESESTPTELIDLGYGPRTAAGYAELVAEGKLDYKENNDGTITLTRTSGESGTDGGAGTLLSEQQRNLRNSFLYGFK